MSSVQIIVGSMLGTTEYVGEACQEQLESLNHQVKIHLQPQFNTIISETISTKNMENPLWVICTSTHGAGDYPDNIQSFVEDLKNCEQDLSSIRFMIIAVGDSSYDTFCNAGINLNNLLISINCKEIAPIKLLDMTQDIDPEDLAQQWLVNNKDLL